MSTNICVYGPEHQHMYIYLRISTKPCICIACMKIGVGIYMFMSLDECIFVYMHKYVSVYEFMVHMVPMCMIIF